MLILDRYIGKTVLFSVFAVLLIIVGLDVVFSFIRELKFLKNDYQLLQAIIYVVSTVPRRVYEFIPVSTLIGCLIGLGGLANTSELVAMRAAGVSITRIVGAACLPVLLAVLLGLVLSEFVVPKTEQYAESQRSIQIKGAKAFRVRHGFWYRDENYFIHVDAIQPNGVMFGVARFQIDQDQALVQTDYSERAIYQKGYWVLEDVRQTHVGEEKVERKNATVMRWDTSLTPDIMSIVVLEPEYLSITGLLEFSRYLQDQGLISAPYFFAFWKKTLQPLATLVMVFIAVSFIFGPLRSVTMGQRVMAGVVAGLTFGYVQDILGHMSVVFNMAPLLAALVPILVCLVLGVWLLRRV